MRASKRIKGVIKSMFLIFSQIIKEIDKIWSFQIPVVSGRIQTREQKESRRKKIFFFRNIRFCFLRN
jgi:hypothetical protein